MHNSVLSLFCCLSMILLPVFLTLLVLLIIHLTKQPRQPRYVLPPIIQKANVSAPKHYANNAEEHVARILASLSSWEYKVINDILIKINEQSVQIDHIIVSIHGIFVLETKDYAGFISGKDSDTFWRQKLSFRKYQFHNPVHQNFGHIQTIRQLLSVYPNCPFFSIIVFTQRCNFGVYSRDTIVSTQNLISSIRKFTDVHITTEDMNTIYDIIKAADIGTEENRRLHNESVQKIILSKQEKIANGICPKCGNKLVKRGMEDNPYITCSNYPYCLFTCKIDYNSYYIDS